MSHTWVWCVPNTSLLQTLETHWIKLSFPTFSVHLNSTLAASHNEISTKATVTTSLPFQTKEVTSACLFMWMSTTGLMWLSVGMKGCNNCGVIWGSYRDLTWLKKCFSLSETDIHLSLHNIWGKKDFSIVCNDLVITVCENLNGQTQSTHCMSITVFVKANFLTCAPSLSKQQIKSSNEL